MKKAKNGFNLAVWLKLLFLLSLVASSASAQPVLVAWANQVWKIDPAGAIKRLDYDFGTPLLETVHGATGPAISPDQKTIAFTRNNDLWMLDVATMTSKQATKLGRPYTRQFAAVFVLLTAWSPDGRRILYYVESGETEVPEGEGPEQKLRQAPYGYHIFDVKSRNSAPMVIPGELLSWLPGGDFLVKTDDSQNARLMRVHTGDKDGALIAAEPGDYGQVSVSPDGKQIVARRGSELVRIELENGKTARLAKGSWAEFQWPNFSPSGKHVSYVRQYPLKERGRYGNELIIDGRAIYRSDRGFWAYWINDERLALLLYDQSKAENHTWVLLDWRSGTEILSKSVH